MQNIRKILLVLPLIMILVLAAGLGFALLTFNDDDYRKGVVSLVNNLSDYRIEIEKPFTLKFLPLPALTTGRLKLRLPDAQTVLDFRDLKLVLQPVALLRGALKLKVAGRIDDRSSLEWLLPEELYFLNRLEFVGQLAVTDTELRVDDFKLKFGKNVLVADLQVSFAGDRPRIGGKIWTQTLHLDNFMKNFSTRLDAEPKEYFQPIETIKRKLGKPASQASLFSRQPFLLNFLHDFECDVKIAVDRVLGFNDVLKNLEINLNLKNNSLKLKPISFTFADGYFKTSLSLSASPGGKYEAKLKGSIDDINLVDALRCCGINSVVKGKLTVDVDLHSRGLSLHDLAAGLGGHLDMALEDGQVPGRTLKLIAVDMLGWSLQNILMEKEYVDISCCILSLQATSGALDCRAFMLESPDLQITGAGSVNLADETCDLVLYPKKKRAFWALVTPVTIKGNLQKPKVQAIPAKKTALFYSGLVFVPQFFIPAVGASCLWKMVSKDKEGVQGPCFEYLQKHPNQPSLPAYQSEKSIDKNPPNSAQVE